MRTILAYTDAYRLEPSGRDEREQVARQQFSEAGLTLDDRKAHQLTFGKSEDSANARFRTEIDTSKSRSREGDLFYVDWEPEHYSHPTKFDLRKANFMSALVRRTVFEYDGDVGVYGLPYNRYWPPFTTKSAVQALTYIHTKTPLDYFSPSCYLNKQAGDRSDQDFIFRQTYPISI